MKTCVLFSLLSVAILSSQLMVHADEIRLKVVDTNGKGVARAFIGVENGNELPLITDQNGDCTVSDVTAQSTVLLVSSGANLVSYRVRRIRQDIKIVLPETSKIEDKTALADELLKKGFLGYDWILKWDALGTERIEAAMLRSLADPNAAQRVYSWNFYLEKLAERDPQDFLNRKDELLKSTPEAGLKNFEILTMKVRTQSDDENEHQTVKDWLEAKKPLKVKVDIESLRELLTLAEIHEKLKTPDENTWLNEAVEIATQLSPNIAPYIYDLGTRTSKISLRATELLCQDWTIPHQITLWQSVIKTHAERGDLPNAKLSFEKITELFEKSKQIPPQTVPDAGGLLFKPAEQMDQARQPYAKLLAQSDPEAAIELSAQLDVFQRAWVMSIAGKSAAQAGKIELARQAWNAIFDTHLGNTEFGSQAAAAALEFAPDLADEICRKTFLQTVPKQAGDVNFFYPCIAALANARAKGWPGESRILIEREWKKRFEYDQYGEKDFTWGHNRERMRALIGAMTRVDAARAIEMAESVSEIHSLRSQSRVEIAFELLRK